MTGPSAAFRNNHFYLRIRVHHLYFSSYRLISEKRNIDRAEKDPVTSAIQILKAKNGRIEHLAMLLVFISDECDVKTSE